MARFARLRAADRRRRPRGAAAAAARRARPPDRGAHPVHGEHALRQHHPRGRSSRRSRATARSSGASRASCAGTRWRWSCGPTRLSDGIGGHISTFASAATLYEVGFNHFFRGRTDTQDGDIIYFQGHASPGIYARAFLEGRLDETAARELPPRAAAGRRAVVVSAPVADARLLAVPDGVDGPRADHGDLPGALQSLPGGSRPEADIRIRRSGRSSATARPTSPRSLGAITLASREKLDNLIFVINCNLQRLDGPVRGNGKIIQELEAVFRGAGWNVIKVIWGSDWDPLLAKDRDGLLVKRMGEIVDGEYQKYAVEAGAYIREHFFGTDPRLLDLVEHSPTTDSKKLRRGGHDPGQGLRRLQGGRRAQGRSRPSSSRGRSRATASARRAKARTSRTSRRS